MNNSPLTVLYDGGCKLCSREIRHYQRLDHERQIRWIDISSSPDRVIDSGLSLKQAMSELHAINIDGEIITGVDAFTAIWSTLPQYRWLVALVGFSPLKKMLEFVYPVFARWRLKQRCLNSSCGNLLVDTDGN